MGQRKYVGKVNFGDYVSSAAFLSTTRTTALLASSSVYVLSKVLHVNTIDIGG